MNFNYSFPAIRGYQAKKEFFTLICPLDVLSKLFNFYNNEIPEEFRAQRVLNEKRIPEIASYMLNNLDSYVFSSITASVDGNYSFRPISQDQPNIGTLDIAMTSNLLINDGQHRKAAIDEAIKENPDLRNESISVVLYVDQGLERSQQMFSDLNRHAVKVSKSNSILYNHRDEEIIFMKAYLETNKKLYKYLDKTYDSIAQKSNKLFTLSNFYKALQTSYGNKNIISDENLQKFVISYWDYLTIDFKEWSFVLNGEISPYHARQSSVAVYGIILESLGKLCYFLYSEKIKNWKYYVKALNKINWQKTNLNDWANRCLLENGSIHKSNAFIDRSYYRIKQLIDLPLTPIEKAKEAKLQKEV